MAEDTRTREALDNDANARENDVKNERGEEGISGSLHPVAGHSDISRSQGGSLEPGKLPERRSSLPRNSESSPTPSGQARTKTPSKPPTPAEGPELPISIGNPDSSSNGPNPSSSNPPAVPKKDFASQPSSARRRDGCFAGLFATLTSCCSVQGTNELVSEDGRRSHRRRYGLEESIEMNDKKVSDDVPSTSTEGANYADNSEQQQHPTLVQQQPHGSAIHLNEGDRRSSGEHSITSDPAGHTPPDRSPTPVRAVLPILTDDRGVVNVEDQILDDEERESARRLRDSVQSPLPPEAGVDDTLPDHAGGGPIIIVQGEEEEELLHEDDRPPLLPPITEKNIGKKCLVLDMDETLLHSAFRIQPNQTIDWVVPVDIDGTASNVFVRKRPHVDIFMEAVGRMYEIVIFTASLAKYADPVLDRLDIHGVIDHRLYRQHCDLHENIGAWVKNLNRLGRPIQDCIIIDNNPSSYFFHPNHAIPVATWYGDENDRELLELLGPLTDMLQFSDVRQMLDPGRYDLDDLNYMGIDVGGGWLLPDPQDNRETPEGTAESTQQEYISSDHETTEERR